MFIPEEVSKVRRGPNIFNSEKGDQENHLLTGGNHAIFNGEMGGNADFVSRGKVPPGFLKTVLKVLPPLSLPSIKSEKPLLSFGPSNSNNLKFSY